MIFFLTIRRMLCRKCSEYNYTNSETMLAYQQLCTKTSTSPPIRILFFPIWQKANIWIKWLCFCLVFKGGIFLNNQKQIGSLKYGTAVFCDWTKIPVIRNGTSTCVNPIKACFLSSSVRTFKQVHFLHSCTVKMYNDYWLSNTILFLTILWGGKFVWSTSAGMVRFRGGASFLHCF